MKFTYRLSGTADEPLTYIYFEWDNGPKGFGTHYPVAAFFDRARIGEIAELLDTFDGSDDCLNSVMQAQHVREIFPVTHELLYPHQGWFIRFKEDVAAALAY